MNNLFRVKYAVVFQSDGLDEQGVINDINEKYGTVFDREDNKLDDDTPVTLIYVDASIGQYALFKAIFNCVEPQKYVLFPMESLEDKKLIETEWQNV